MRNVSNLIQIKHNTNIPTESTSLSYGVSTEVLNDQEIVSLFQTLNPEDLPNSPSEAILKYINIENNDTVFENKDIDIRKYLYFPQDQKSPLRFGVKDDNIFLFQIMSPEISPVQSPTFMYLVWMDRSGNLKSKVEYLNDGNYYYTNIHILGVRNNITYILGKREDDQNSGYDILSINEGSNSAAKVGSIYLPKDKDINFIVQQSILTDDNGVIIGLWLQKTFENINTSFNYVLRFETSELGIISKSIDIKNLNNKFKVYPNPTSNILNISCINCKDAAFEILDVNGRSILQSKLLLENENSIDISHLESGMYFYTVHSKDQHLYSGKWIKI